MTPTTTKGGRTYPPQRISLQAVAMGGIPQGTVEYLPVETTMDVPFIPSTAYVVHRGYPPGVTCTGSDKLN